MIRSTSSSVTSSRYCHDLSGRREARTVAYYNVRLTDHPVPSRRALASARGTPPPGTSPPATPLQEPLYCGSRGSLWRLPDQAGYGRTPKPASEAATAASSKADSEALALI